MQKKILLLILLLIVFALFCITAYAHSGRTDSKGGHTNSTTGEYHYHHGYPAHDHPNGVCPYSSDKEESKNYILNRILFLVVSLAVNVLLWILKPYITNNSSDTRIYDLVQYFALIICAIALFVLFTGE